MYWCPGVPGRGEPGRAVAPNVQQGPYTMSPKKNPGLFQDFQGHFSQFSRTKNHKSTADSHSNDMFRTMFGSVAQGK